MTRLLAVLAVLLVSHPAAATQKTKAQMSTTITTSLPSSGQGQITAAILRSVLQDMVDSYQQIGLVNAQTGTTYTILAGDSGKLITFNNAAPVAVTLPQALGDFGNGFNFAVQNLGAGAVTITPTVSTINGAASLTLNQNNISQIFSDGANYRGLTYGTMVSVTCGAGLSGGVITTTGTCSITDVISGQSSVGSASVVPIISFNDRGQLTSVTTATVSAGSLGALLIVNNLSDLGDVNTARGNLGLTNIATTGSATDLITGTVPAARMPALTGDVTTTAGTVATTISPGAVTFAKIQNIAGSRLFGNPNSFSTTGSEISLGATLAFSGSALQTGAGSGDVTWSANAFTTTISNGAVTFSKLANLAALSVIGNTNGFSTTPAAVTFSQFADTITTQRGTMLFRGAAGWQGLGPCTAGQVAGFGGSGADMTCTSVAGSGTVTSIAQGAGMTFSSNPITTTGTISADIATSANFLQDTANKLLDPSGVWTSAIPFTLTDTTSIAIDLSAGINFQVTLAGNRSLNNPTNIKTGQTGVVWITQDGSGNRTLSYSSNWKFAGGTQPVLSTSPGFVDLLVYSVKASNFIYGTLVKGIR